MKAIFTLRTQIAALTITMISFVSGAQQTGVIWTKVTNPTLLGTSVVNNRLVSTNPMVSGLISQFNIQAIDQAVPASRNEDLQKIYQIECTCNEHDLLAEVAKMKSLFTAPEIGPRYETMGTPNDYSLTVSNDYALNLINAQGAWNITEGDSSILISITDAGYYMDNYELFPKVVSSNLNFYQSNPAHGTAVATVAAGYTNNGYGKSAIGFNSSLDLRPMNYNGLLEATYAGAHVINASWAAGCYYSQYGQDIINEVYNNGSIIIASAGNGSTCNNASTKVYPASFDHVISVTSVGPSNNHERTPGNATTTHQHNDAVDISAPGYDVAVTTTAGTFITANGTSFASPYVAGTVALMLSVNRCLTYEDVDYILKASADSTIYEVNPQYIGGLGAGRLDAAKAVQMAKEFSKFEVFVSQSVVCESNSYQLFTSGFYGEAPYTIEWSNGVTGPLNSVNASGFYTLNVTDNRGCRHNSVIEVVEYTEMTVESSINEVSCAGLSNGSIVLEVTGGKGSYEYAWSTGSTTSLIQDLTSGLYSVIITDAAGCEKTEAFEILEPSAMSISTENINPLSGTETGSIDVSVTGGNGVYSYLWQNGSTTEDLYNVSAGVYEVTVTDGNGCTITTWAVLQGSMASVEEQETGTVNVYPNPAVDVINVSWENTTVKEIKVMNLEGRIISSVTPGFETTYTMNTEELTSGVYIFMLENENGTVNKIRWIKK